MKNLSLLLYLLLFWSCGTRDTSKYKNYYTENLTTNIDSLTMLVKFLSINYKRNIQGNRYTTFSKETLYAVTNHIQIDVILRKKFDFLKIKSVLVTNDTINLIRKTTYEFILQRLPGQEFSTSYIYDTSATKFSQKNKNEMIMRNWYLVFGKDSWGSATQITSNKTISGTRLPPFLGGYDEGAAIFKGPNPYGPNGHFRTIEINYSMNIKVFKYDSAAKNAIKIFIWLMK